MIAPLRHLITRDLPAPLDKSVADRIEQVRSDLADQDGTAQVLYSPKPGSSDHIKVTNERPQVGKAMSFNFRRLANHTSISPKWGQAMYLLGKESGAQTAIELGSCAGISGAYIASIPTIKRLETIEGSEDLARIAQSTLEQVGTDVPVTHNLFDNALDDMIPTLADVDFVWIDGHHESVATIHYFERLMPTLAPGAVVLFDDIYWSRDMLDGWTNLSSRRGFSHTVDMGKLGACIWVGGDIEPQQWDVRDVILSRRPVGNPENWS